MPKLKPHKGVLKRFKLTKNGKLKYKRAGSNHLNSGKGGKRIRQLRKPGILAPVETRRLKKMLEGKA
jgi:large subunit ribosomal protein L35